MNFDLLIYSIRKTHDLFQRQAIKAVNINLTLRNWLVGYSIVEFEQQGEDRAKYGDQLLTTIASKLNIKGLAETNLKLSRQFYLVYPQILGTISQIFGEKWSEQISQTLSDQFQGLNCKIGDCIKPIITPTAYQTLHLPVQCTVQTSQFSLFPFLQPVEKQVPIEWFQQISEGF